MPRAGGKSIETAIISQGAGASLIKLVAGDNAPGLHGQFVSGADEVIRSLTGDGASQRLAEALVRDRASRGVSL